MNPTPESKRDDATIEPPPSEPSARAKALLLVLTAVSLYFSTGATSVPLAAWLTAAFALRFGRSTSPLWGYTALALVSMPVLASAWSLFPFGGAIGLIILAVIAGLSSALPILFDRIVSTRLRGFARTLPFPVAATALDFLLGASPDFGSWGATGYSQIDSLATMQLVSLTGLLGLTFLIAWVAAAVNGVWETRGNLRKGWLSASPAFAALIIALAWGQARVAFAPLANDLIQITAVGGPKLNAFPNPDLRDRWKQGDALDSGDIEALRQHNDAANNATIDAAQRAAIAGSELIAWGEGGVVVVDEDIEALTARLSSLARAHEATIVASVIVLPTGADERRWDNKVLFVARDGEVEWAYRKAIPTPGGERAISLRGDGKLLSSELQAAPGDPRIAALICYDLDFPDLVAQAGREHVDILVGPAGDWPEVALIHAKMARARAIEQGVVLVRPTTGGVTVVYDGLGRVLAQTHTTDGSIRSVTTWVPTNRHFTLYGVFAAVFGWLSVLGAVILIGLRIARRNQPASEI